MLFTASDVYTFTVDSLHGTTCSQQHQRKFAPALLQETQPISQMGVHEYSVTLQHAQRKCCRMHALYTFPSVRDALGWGHNWRFGPFAFAGRLCRQLAVPQCTRFESSHRLCAASDSRLCRNMYLDNPPHSALLQVLMLQMGFLVQMLLFELLRGQVKQV